MLYDVTLIRTAYQGANVEVEADSEEGAHCAALDRAGDLHWATFHADEYGVEGAEARPTIIEQAVRGWAAVEDAAMTAFTASDQAGGPTPVRAEDSAAPTCPECGSGEAILYLEDITCQRLVLGRFSDGALKIDGSYTTEGWDEDGARPRLACGLCGREWPLDGDGPPPEFV